MIKIDECPKCGGVGLVPPPLVSLFERTTAPIKCDLCNGKKINVMENYYEMTIEHFLEVYEKMNGKKLSENEKKNITKYATEFPKMSIALPKNELEIMRNVKKLQIEILDDANCDQLRILV